MSASRETRSESRGNRAEHLGDDNCDGGPIERWRRAADKRTADSDLTRWMTYGLLAAAALTPAIACTSENGTEPTPPAITITLSPSSATVDRGSSTTVTVTVTGSGGFSGEATITVEGVPAGVTGSLSGVTSSGGTTTATVTIDVAASVTPGVYPITVRATGSGVADVTATFTLTVSIPPDFALSIDPDSLDVEQTTSEETTVTIGRTGFTGPVTLSLVDAPAGVTGTFDPAAPTGATSTLTLTADATATPGVYSLSIDGTGTPGARSTELILVVTEERIFSLAVDPDSLTIEQGQNAQSTVTITRTNFAGAVTLTLEDAPAGVTGTFDPSAPTGDNSTLTVTVDSSTTPGDYELTVSGTTASGSASAGVALGTSSTPLALTVLPAPDYALSVDPDSLTIEQGMSDQTTVTIARTNFTGAVTLSLNGAPAGVTGTFVPDAPTGDNSTLTLDVGASVTPGTYALTVDGTGDPGARSASLTLIVPPPPDYALSVEPESLTVQQGGNGQASVTITRTNFTGAVTLTLGNTPAGVTGVFDPAAPTDDASTLTVTVDATVTPGDYSLTVDGTGAPGARSTALTLTVVEPPDYSLSVEPDSLTIEQGMSDQTTVTISRTNFPDAVTLSLGNAPAGVTGTFDPETTTGDASTLTVNVDATVAPGTYALTVDGTSAGGNTSTSLTLIVTAIPDYALSVDPDSLAIEQGMSDQTTVTIARTNFTGAVTLTLGGAPAGVTGTFNPAMPTGDNSTLTVNVGASVTPGEYSLTVDGNGAPGARSTPLTLTVTPTPDYSLSVDPDSLTIEQGMSDQTTVTISRTNFTGAVTLTLGGAPAGVTGTFNPAMPTGDMSTLTVDVDGSVTPGDYPLTVDGTGSPGNRSTALTLTVTEPGSFTLSVSPDSLTIEQGSSAQTTVTITRVNFPDAVTLSLDSAPAGMTGTFNPAAPTGDNSTLTVNVDGSVAPGVYDVKVSGSGGSPSAPASSAAVDSDTDLTVTVTAPPGYTLSMSPSAVSVPQGSSTSATININRTGGFSESVSLSVSGEPTGLTATPNPASTIGNSSTLDITVSGSVTPGTYTLTITGMAAGVPNETTTINVTVTMAGGGTSVTLDFSACDTEDRPIWLAYQDGTGSWMRVIGSGDVYMFTLSQSKGGVTWVTDDAGDINVSVVYATASELAAAAFTACTPADTKTVNGTVAGLAMNEVAQTSLGGRAVMSGNGPITFTMVPDGNVDVVGIKPWSDPSTGGRGFLLRDQNIADMGSLPVDVDYSGPNSFALASANVTVVGLDAMELTGVTVNYATVGSCHRAPLYLGAVTGSPVVVYGMPGSVQDSDDRHNVMLSATDTVTNTSRSVSETFLTLADRTLTLPMAMADPAVTSLGGNYKRLQGSVTVPSEYDAFYSFMYNNSAADRSVSIFASAGWVGSLSIVLGLDDYSGVAGWMDSWPPAPTDMVTWTMFAAGGNFLGDACTSGTSVMTSRTGTQG